MAPISPISRKRSTPLSEDGSPDEPSRKKRCIEPTLPQTPPPDAEQEPKANVSTIPLYNDTPRELLIRSVALILEHVGFSGASEEALEGLCAEVDAYASRFLAQVTQSMLLGRRHESAVLDFGYALSKFSIPFASLEPHLRHPVAPLHTEEEDEDPPNEEQSQASLTKLLGNELSGQSDKNGKPFIPKHFPSFPSKHTYKFTEKESARETDPRKVREEAAKSARQAEEALRRLVRVSKAGREKDVKRVAEKDPKSKMRHDLWEKAMESLNSRKRKTAAKADQDDDHSMIVNSESQYFRKPAVKKRKPAPIQPEG